MMSSLLILMSDIVFACGCTKKSFGYLIVTVGSGVMKTLLYCYYIIALYSRFGALHVQCVCVCVCVHVQAYIYLMT